MRDRQAGECRLLPQNSAAGYQQVVEDATLADREIYERPRSKAITDDPNQYPEFTINTNPAIQEPAQQQQRSIQPENSNPTARCGPYRSGIDPSSFYGEEEEEEDDSKENEERCRTNNNTNVPPLVMDDTSRVEEVEGSTSLFNVAALPTKVSTATRSADELLSLFGYASSTQSQCEEVITKGGGGEEEEESQETDRPVPPQSLSLDHESIQENVTHTQSNDFELPMNGDDVNSSSSEDEA